MVWFTLACFGGSWLGLVCSVCFSLDWFSVEMRGHLFTVRVTEHRLPKEAVQSPSLETFRAHLAAILHSVLQVILLSGGLD